MEKSPFSRNPRVCISACRRHDRRIKLFAHRQILTRILDGRDDEPEAIGVGAPCVSDVFQRHEVRARVNRAHGLLRVSAG